MAKDVRNIIDKQKGMKIMTKRAIFANEGADVIERVYGGQVEQRLRQNAGLEFLPFLLTKESLPQHKDSLAQVEIIFSTWGMPSFTRQEIQEYLPRLKAVFYAAGSVQYFAKPFIEEGVSVFSAWQANGIPVAEMTVSQIVLANKGYYQGMRRFQTQGHALSHSYCNTFPGTYDGVKIGLIGCGAIGSLVAELLYKNHTCQVLAFDPFLSSERAKQLRLEKVTLEELFSQCQTISNHLANNPQTLGMLSYDLFKRMKPNATFINTGRGAQVVEADLIRALREEPGRTALLDVTWPEPPEEGSPFYSLDNVFLTPHIAGSMGQEVKRMGLYMEQCCDAFLAGQPVPYQVTAEMLHTMA